MGVGEGEGEEEGEEEEEEDVEDVDLLEDDVVLRFLKVFCLLLLLF